jgi:hypothetical protein
METYIENAKAEQDERIKYGRIKGLMLNEVKVKDRKWADKYRTESLAGAGNADQVMHSEELERVGGLLSTSLNGRLHGVTFVPGPDGVFWPYLTTNVMSGIGSNFPAPMLVIVDGAIISPPNIDFYNLGSVETVEVLKSANTSIYGSIGATGVLVITTKQGGGLDPKDVASIGVLPITPKGFYKAREFYSPKYDNTNLSNKQPDLRSTIYWKPEIQTDKDGNASFDYYNADGKGTYKVIVEGIDSKGNLGRQVYRYKVE